MARHPGSLHIIPTTIITTSQFTTTIKLSVDPKVRRYLNVFRHGASVWLHRTVVLWCCGGVGGVTLMRRQQTSSSTPDKHSPQAFPYLYPNRAITLPPSSTSAHHLHSPVMCGVEALERPTTSGVLGPCASPSGIPKERDWSRRPE
jgi:hypothetical protein